MIQLEIGRNKMRTPLLEGGKLRLIRNSSIVRGEDGVLTFSVTLSVDAEAGFTQALADYKLTHVFVHRDSEYVRPVTLEDYIGIPAGHPLEVGGEYRVSSTTRQFRDAGQGTAWIRSIYDHLNNLVTGIKDYVAVFDSEKYEEVWVPDTTVADLYNRIQDYLADVTELETVNGQLSVARGKLEVLDEVYDNTLIDDPASTSYLGAVDVLKASLPRINGIMETVSAQLQSSLGLQGGIQNLPNALAKIDGDCRNFLTIIASRADQIKTLANDPLVPTTPGEDIIITAEALLAANSSVGTALDYIRGMLENYISDMTVSDRGINLMRGIMTLTGVTSTDAVNAVEKMNVVGGVKTQELQTLRRRLVKDIAVWEDEVERLIESRQNKLDRIKQLAPDVDPSDPMKLFNYRVFRVPS